MDPQRFINSSISTGDSHYGIIDEKGILSMVGENEYGQLGNGTTQPSKIPVSLQFPSKVINISCGGNSTGVVTEDGKAYRWGQVLEDADPELGVKQPQLIKDFQHRIDNHAIKISVSPYGGSAYGVVFQDGTAYLELIIFMDQEDYELSQMIKINPGIVDILVDLDIAYILTKDGKIYVTGLADLPVPGKYLRGEETDDISIGLTALEDDYIITPVPVPFGKAVQQFCRNHDGLLVLTTDGEIYGMSSYGEAGPEMVNKLIEMGMVVDPRDLETVIQNSRPKKISTSIAMSFISSVNFTSAAISKDRKLHMWGWDGFGMITGITTWAGWEGKAESFKKPIELDLGSKVNYVSIGLKYTLAATQDGEIKYWGNYELRPLTEINPGWHTNCSNPKSLTTLEKWKDQTDYVKIYGRTTSGELVDRPICYDRQNIIKFTMGNEFADWVPKPDPNNPGKFQTIDVSGRGGKAGKKRFYRTIESNFTDQASFFLLQDPSIHDYVREIKLLDQRIGNLKGTFGTGQHHGQSPGFTIFSLRAKPS